MERRPHPVDEFGLAVRPPDISLECNPEACRQIELGQEPFRDRQHVYHPRREFNQGQLKALRSCSRFVVRMCRCEHERWDTEYDSPPQPPIAIVQAFKAGDLPYTPNSPLE